MGQTTFVEKILKKFGHLLEKKDSGSLPLPTGAQLDVEVKTDTKFPFREVLGFLMYLRVSRLDLLFALHALSKIAHKPGPNGVKAIKRTLAYIKKTKHMTRSFFPGKVDGGKVKLLAFADA